jgi:hypothetical protein
VERTLADAKQRTPFGQERPVEHGRTRSALGLKATSQLGKRPAGAFTTQNLARREGELYVVTGPLFEGESLQRMDGRVLVPTSVFKAIYSPQQQAAAYVTPNAQGMAYLTLSIADLEKRAHITVFPTLPQQIKETKMPLPVPTPDSSRGRPQQTRRSRTDHNVTPCQPFNPLAATPHLSRLAT